MNETKLSPAQRVIAAFGGIRAVARAVDRNPTTVLRWRMSKEEGGTGGRIPSTMQERVLAEAKARGLDLTPADLILPPGE